MLIEINGGSKISQTMWGRTNPRGWGQKPVIWQDFLSKLHENEMKKFGPGGRVPSAPPHLMDP